MGPIPITRRKNQPQGGGIMQSNFYVILSKDSDHIYNTNEMLWDPMDTPEKSYVSQKPGIAYKFLDHAIMLCDDCYSFETLLDMEHFVETIALLADNCFDEHEPMLVKVSLYATTSLYKTDYATVLKRKTSEEEEAAHLKAMEDALAKAEAEEQAKDTIEDYGWKSTEDIPNIASIMWALEDLEMNSKDVKEQSWAAYYIGLLTADYIQTTTLENLSSFLTNNSLHHLVIGDICQK
jgi:hypothetical protein